MAGRVGKGALAVIAIDTGEVSGTAAVNAHPSLAAVDDLNAVMVVPESATDPAAAAAKLVEILGGDAASYEAALSGATPGPCPC